MIDFFDFHIDPLAKSHNRADFCSGVPELDVYLHRGAGQDMRRLITAVFVLTSGNCNAILGYYTLSATSVKLDEFPDQITKKLPKYPYVPSTLLGRLAVDRKYQGQGFGEMLLTDALHRSLSQSRGIASMAVIVEAKDEKACAFYKHYGFQSFPDTTKKMFLPMKIIQKLFV